MHDPPEVGRMSCREIGKLLPEYAVGALDDAAARRVREHVEECAACRRELDGLISVGELLIPIELVTPPRDLWPSIAARLEPRRARMSWWRAHSRPAFALAAAAAVLLAVAVGLPVLNGPALLAPVVEAMPVVAEGEAVGYTEAQLAAAWNQPFADEASLALAMTVLDPQEAIGETMQ